MDPSAIGSAVGAVVALLVAVAAGLKHLGGGGDADTPSAMTTEQALLDRIEDLTTQLDHERERADSFEEEVGRLRVERVVLTERVAALESQVALLLDLIRPKFQQ